ncbi:MAG: glutathione S-transferase [Roseomonas sp.]|jgi:glutathione S-transferase|nr:glutathione S-transferase [Roseomonas sp.]
MTPGRLRIFSYLPNPRVAKATIAGRLCDVAVELRGSPPAELKSWLWDFNARPLTWDDPQGGAQASQRGFGGGTLHKTEAFLKANPFGTVPTAFSPDGAICVFESNSIMRLVARLGVGRRSLLGSGPFEASRVDSFLDEGLTFAHDVQRYLLSLRTGQLDVHTHEYARRAAASHLGGIERALSPQSAGIVGPELTLADISFACDICQLTHERRSMEVLAAAGLPPVLGRDEWLNFPRALGHFERLLGLPEFAQDLSVYAEICQALRP